ncbi:MAG TPA: ABC transporter substrate-binding protein [Pseudothermotoga sp.]|nr:ABC transporter substrate-binding protein [Pseudothermotoga sp.]HOK83802.1 ABC transporter substrate-binding protein [Pseudothermotoga sp.]HPP70294.1 ABC transporter substrate-binding protein [Pseudothermotoga sp.]
MRKRLAVFAVVLLAAFSFASYLNVAVLGDVRSLNPFLVKSSAERIVVGYLYETLLTESLGQVVGAVAESWQVDLSTNSMILKLRDRKFHDGTDVTADDVVFSFNYILEKKLPLGPILAYFTGAQKVDEKTVKLSFRTMNVSMLSFAPMAIPIIPKSIWEKIDKPLEFPNIEKPVGSGMLSFEKLTPQSVVLKFFKDHPNASQNLQGMVLNIVQDETMGFLGLVKGDYDYLFWNLDPELAKQVMENPNKYPNVKIALIDGGLVNVILFNHRKQPMDDVNFRKAVLYAINYKELIEKVYSGLAEPASLGLMPKRAKNIYDESVQKVEQNISMAKDFIKKSGYDGKKLTLLVSSDRKSMDTAEYIKLYLKNIGVEVELDVQGPEGLTTKLKKADFDLVIYSYNLGSHPEMVFYHLHSSRGTMKDGQVTGFNYGGVSIKELDTALEGIWMAFSEQDRIMAFKNLQKLFGEVVPVVPLVVPVDIEAYSVKNFTGWFVSSAEGVMNTETMKSLKPVR